MMTSETSKVSEPRFDSTAIWTLDARDNVMLTVLADYLRLSQVAMRRAIVESLDELRGILTSKGVNYSKLKAALVPSRDKREASFVFNIERFGKGNYALLGSREIIPLLSRESKHSLLSGDLLGDISGVNALIADSTVTPHKRPLDKDAPHYAIHVNNLTTNALESIHDGLTAHPEYAGYIDCTYSSFARTYLSTTLSSSFVKNGATVIGLHEPDVPSWEDYNITAWPWEEANYTVRSVPDYFYHLFLTYKIERSQRDSPSDDTRFGLTSISSQTRDSATFEVAVAPSRVKYLLEQKSGAMDLLGLNADLKAEILAQLIQGKLTDSYFYNLQYRAEYSISQFNVIVEIELADGTKRRALAGLKYTDGDSRLELLTMY